jgi:hypothetical protein
VHGKPSPLRLVRGLLPAGESRERQRGEHSLSRSAALAGQQGSLSTQIRREREYTPVIAPVKFGSGGVRRASQNGRLVKTCLMPAITPCCASLDASHHVAAIHVFLDASIDTNRSGPKHVSCPQIPLCSPTLRRFELVPQVIVSTRPYAVSMTFETSTTSRPTESQDVAWPCICHCRRSVASHQPTAPICDDVAIVVLGCHCRY